MQKTIYENEDGELSLLQEKFYSEAKTAFEAQNELFSKMNDRLAELEPQGHELVGRTFKDKFHENKARKIKKKLARME